MACVSLRCIICMQKKKKKKIIVAYLKCEVPFSPSKVSCYFSMASPAVRANIKFNLVKM